MLKRISRYYHTIKYLKPIQIRYQLYYKLLRLLNLFGRGKLRVNIPQTQTIVLGRFIDKPNSYDGDLCFEFLNITHQFDEAIRWNLASYGKLWTYNLCYFDFLNQPNVDRKKGIALMSLFANEYATIKDGLEPYPSSLRVINWIKFIAKHEIKDEKLIQTINSDVYNIRKTLEYHLMGNHLLENGFALLYGSVYVNDDKLYKKSKTILMEQLNEQILTDGAHFELSPMYHQIILDRLLDSINLLTNQPTDLGKDLLLFLKSKANDMISWLENITFENGAIPLVNDSTFDIAPTTEQLIKYANSLGVKSNELNLSKSGYRKFANPVYECLADVGNIGPNYIPGHAHSDTFNFVLHYKGKPMIVDTGTSTYEKNHRRTIERSTAAHNTVVINGEEQTQVWGGFRVANRALATILHESLNTLSATHNGYREAGITHQRDFEFSEKSIVINDVINKEAKATAYFHLAPGLTTKIEGDRAIIGGFGHLSFKNYKTIKTEKFLRAEGFNKTAEANVIMVEFDQLLKTEIKFK